MARPIVDITGNRYGKLVVLGISAKRTPENKPFWRVRCDCGVEKDVIGNNMKNGVTNSCGCDKREKAGAKEYYGSTFDDLTGRTYGLWLVLEFAGRRAKTAFWNCQCECGNVRVVNGQNLKRGYSFSCGCSQKKIAAETAFKHGMSHHPGYAAWSSMKNRCINDRDPDYKYYGAKGVKIWQPWLGSFDQFWQDMGPTWQKGLTLDRENPFGNYEPSNCRWVTWEVQRSNKRVNFGQLTWEDIESSLLDPDCGPVNQT